MVKRIKKVRHLLRNPISNKSRLSSSNKRWGRFQVCLPWIALRIRTSRSRIIKFRKHLQWKSLHLLLKRAVALFHSLTELIVCCKINLGLKLLVTKRLTLLMKTKRPKSKIKKRIISNNIRKLAILLQLQASASWIRISRNLQNLLKNQKLKRKF